MLKAYGHLSSGNCYKVFLALRQLHIPHEWVSVDALTKETRQPEYLAKNPQGKIPLLEIEPGQFLSESNAILMYLAEGTTLCPSDRYHHAQVLQWLFYEQYYHEPYIATSRYVMRFLGNPPDRQTDITRWKNPGLNALEVMNNHLKAHPFFVADQYSVADITLYAYTHVADEGGFDLSDYPAIRAWIVRVEQQADFAAMQW